MPYKWLWKQKNLAKAAKNFNLGVYNSVYSVKWIVTILTDNWESTFFFPKHACFVCKL